MDNLTREAQFHDARANVESEGYQRLGYVYSSMQDVMQIPVTRCESDARSVLEVGCYLGNNSRQFSNKQYLGVDISPAAIEIASNKNTNRQHQFLVHDANHLEQLDGEFDYVFGNGVIHHLNLDAFSKGLSNILSESGKAVFFEPMKGPLYLRLFRWLTPKLRTEDEHPLTHADLKKFEETFDVGIEYYGFARPILPMLTGNLNFFIKISAIIDRILLKSFLKSQAWIVIITFTRKRL